MKKLLFVFFLAVGLLFVLPAKASADEGTSPSVRHAYRPYTVAENGWMKARINNVADMPQKRLVCVEAFNNANNAKTHLGCLWVDMAAHNSGGMWGVEFNAPTSWLSPGNYTVVYTYQAGDGSWNRIKSMDLKVMDGMYSK